MWAPKHNHAQAVFFFLSSFETLMAREKNWNDGNNNGYLMNVTCFFGDQRRWSPQQQQTSNYGKTQNAQRRKTTPLHTINLKSPSIYFVMVFPVYARLFRFHFSCSIAYISRQKRLSSFRFDDSSCTAPYKPRWAFRILQHYRCVLFLSSE